MEKLDDVLKKSNKCTSDLLKEKLDDVVTMKILNPKIDRLNATSAEINDHLIRLERLIPTVNDDLNANRIAEIVAGLEATIKAYLEKESSAQELDRTVASSTISHFDEIMETLNPKIEDLTNASGLVQGSLSKLESTIANDLQKKLQELTRQIEDTTNHSREKLNEIRQSSVDMSGWSEIAKKYASDQVQLVNKIDHLHALGTDNQGLAESGRIIEMMQDLKSTIQAKESSETASCDIQRSLQHLAAKIDENDQSTADDLALSKLASNVAENHMELQRKLDKLYSVSVDARKAESAQISAILVKLKSLEDSHLQEGVAVARVDNTLASSVIPQLQNALRLLGSQAGNKEDIKGVKSNLVSLDSSVKNLKDIFSHHTEKSSSTQKTLSETMADISKFIEDRKSTMRSWDEDMKTLVSPENGGGDVFVQGQAILQILEGSLLEKENELKSLRLQLAAKPNGSEDNQKLLQLCKEINQKCQSPQQRRCGFDVACLYVFAIPAAFIFISLTYFHFYPLPTGYKH